MTPPHDTDRAAGYRQRRCSMHADETNEKGHDPTLMTDKELDGVVGGDFSAAVAPIATVAIVNAGLVLGAAITEQFKHSSSAVAQGEPPLPSETASADDDPDDAPF